MGFAYLGIGVGGGLVPLLAYALTQAYGWQMALKLLGLLMIAVALPPAFFIRERPPVSRGADPAVPPPAGPSSVSARSFCCSLAACAPSAPWAARCRI